MVAVSFCIVGTGNNCHHHIICGVLCRKHREHKCIASFSILMHLLYVHGPSVRPASQARAAAFGSQAVTLGCVLQVSNTESVSHPYQAWPPTALCPGIVPFWRTETSENSRAVRLEGAAGGSVVGNGLGVRPRPVGGLLEQRVLGRRGVHRVGDPGVPVRLDAAAARGRNRSTVSHEPGQAFINGEERRTDQSRGPCSRPIWCGLSSLRCRVSAWPIIAAIASYPRDRDLPLQFSGFVRAGGHIRGSSSSMFS